MMFDLEATIEEHHELLVDAIPDEFGHGDLDIDALEMCFAAVVQEVKRLREVAKAASEFINQTGSIGSKGHGPKAVVLFTDDFYEKINRLKDAVKEMEA